MKFSHDHSFNNVVVVENQPEYTDYVEELARQWTEYLDREKYFSRSSV